jgi:hypothetical protein
MDQSYWTALADDYAAAAPGALGHNPPRSALLLAMSVAEHETNNGRAWPGAWNFGAVQLRALTAAEQAAFASGQLHAGDYTRATGRADVPRGILQIDTHPGPNGPERYGVWFAAFDTRVQGIAYYLRTLWRLTGGAAESPDATCATVAEAMYRHGYFEGSHHGARPMGARTGPLTPPEAANVADYAADMARCLATIGPALDGWDTPWHAAITEDVHANATTPEPAA